jgi:hypothetical protein
MKKLFLLLFAAFLFQNSECNKCTVAALPDLFATAIEITQKPGGFVVGDIATVALSIQNLIDLTSNCTEVAGATEYETNLYHRANASSAWTNVGKATYS